MWPHLASASPLQCRNKPPLDLEVWNYSFFSKKLRFLFYIWLTSIVCCVVLCWMQHFLLHLFSESDRFSLCIVSVFARYLLFMYLFVCMYVFVFCPFCSSFFICSCCCSCFWLYMCVWNGIVSEVAARLSYVNALCDCSACFSTMRKCVLLAISYGLITYIY